MILRRLYCIISCLKSFVLVKESGLRESHILTQLVVWLKYHRLSRNDTTYGYCC
ncbi:unnamed protein product [Meloidogyne enterolobii]|uniref:Uncharacterized protein n=1 Tax=Meloidogyne enterolobii TaxID=390850 RepID=A0ACB0XKR8_MELEN